MIKAPDVIPSSVNVTLDRNPESIATLCSTPFDIVYDLDNDREACALTNSISAAVKKGFFLRGGKCAPIEKDAEHKYLTGVFDDLNKANTNNYPQEIFELCGFAFCGERYILDNFASEGCRWRLSKKKIIGLNTGCDGRWALGLWPEKHWMALARKPKKAGYLPLLLGGEQEHWKDLKIAKASGATYLGYFPLKQFINLVAQIDP